VGAASDCRLRAVVVVIFRCSRPTKRCGLGFIDEVVVLVIATWAALAMMAALSARACAQGQRVAAVEALVG